MDGPESERKGKIMQTMVITVAVHKSHQGERENVDKPKKRTGLHRWLARLNGWTVAWYALLTVAGVLLYKAGAAYALRERGYHAVGGEALTLLLPVFWYTMATTIRDIVRDWKARG